MQAELDDIRRRVAQDFGETFPPPPPQSSMGTGKGLLPSPRFTQDQVSGQLRVEIGSKPGQRQVCLTLSGASSQRNGAVGGDLEVVVNASGDRSRTVRIKEAAAPRGCLVCKAQTNKRCPVCKVPYCSAKCQLDDWPTHQGICGGQQGQGSSLQQQTTAGEKRGAMQAHWSQSNERGPPGSSKGKPPSPRTTPSFAAKEQPTGTVKRPGEGSGARPAVPERAPFPTARPPVPRPEPPRSVQLEPASLPMEESVEVTVCYGTDLSELFLQRASSLPALSELQSRLQAACATGGAYRPSQGATCAAQFEDDGQWYRARVSALQDGRCTVYFVDYGNSASVAATQTCPLPAGCSELAEQAVRCGLFGVRPKGDTGWGEGAALELAALMRGRLLARVCRLANGKHEVDLHGDDGGSLSEVLVSKGLAESTLPPAVAAPAAPPPKTELPSVLSLAKPGEALALQVTVSSKGQLWVLVAHPGVTTQLLQAEEELNERCPKLAEGASASQGVSSGDYVASKSLEDGRWYRARVTGTTPSGHVVHYVDYGNDEANTHVVPLEEKHLKVAAASARLDGKDVASLPVGATLRFTVEGAAGDGGVVRGQLVCEDDGKALGPATLSPWDFGLREKTPPAADKASPQPKHVKPVEEVAP
ncbi:unnamed protein product, partial [Ixodes hexagonus]